MAIDRIGKGGGVGVPPAAANEAGGAARPAAASRPFETKPSEKPGGSLPPAPVAPAAATPLDKLRAGQTDLHGYLDMKVEEATAHLHGLRPGELDQVKKMLRDQLATDPALTDLVKQATGNVPEPPRDE